MNKGLAHQLKNILEPIPYLNKIGGLVYTQIREEQVKNSQTQAVQKILKKFPVTCDASNLSSAECEAGNLTSFIPDSKIPNMLYFEDLGTMSVGYDGHFFKFISKLRLVGWFDTRTIVPFDPEQQEINCFQFGTIIITDIINRFNAKRSKNIGIYRAALIDIDRILPQDANIFSKYNYDERYTQYLMPPYEYFGIDLSINYGINPNCITLVKEAEGTIC